MNVRLQRNEMDVKGIP